MNASGSVGVIGAGAVARSVTVALTAAMTRVDLLICSRTFGQAEALALDLQDMQAALGAPARAQAVTHPEELATCDVVVIAARARFVNKMPSPDQRMGGLHANAPLITKIGQALYGYRGTVLVVTNPVDIMARLFADASGCPHIYGIGSNVDTARYHAVLSDVFCVPPTAVGGHVIGEHGTHMTILTSSTTVSGKPATIPIRQVRDAILGRSPRINAGTGRTICGPAGAVLSTIRRVSGLNDGIEELSARWRHPGGVFLGQLVRFTSGSATTITPPLAPSEGARLTASAERLDALYQQVSALPLHTASTKEATSA